MSGGYDGAFASETFNALVSPSSYPRRNDEEIRAGQRGGGGDDGGGDGDGGDGRGSGTRTQRKPTRRKERGPEKNNIPIDDETRCPPVAARLRIRHASGIVYSYIFGWEGEGVGERKGDGFSRR